VNGALALGERRRGEFVIDYALATRRLADRIRDPLRGERP
jgi:hypothetical protein